MQPYMRSEAHASIEKVASFVENQIFGRFWKKLDDAGDLWNSPEAGLETANALADSRALQTLYARLLTCTKGTSTIYPTQVPMAKHCDPHPNARRLCDLKCFYTGSGPHWNGSRSCSPVAQLDARLYICVCHVASRCAVETCCGRV